MALPPFPLELSESDSPPDTSALGCFPFPPAPPIYVTDIATRVSAHPDAEIYLGPGSEIVKSDLEMLELLIATFSAPMPAWRSQALQSASALASYYNLGAFAQSSRFGITKVSFQYQDVLPALNAWLRSKFPGHSWSSICVNHNEAISMHRDLNNAEGSLNLTIALGNFSDGGLFVEAPGGAAERWCATVGAMIPGNIHTTKAWPFAFSGFLWHASEPWQGDRWSITGYTCRDLEKFATSDFTWLQGKGFALPAKPNQTSPPATLHPALQEEVSASLATPASDTDATFTPAEADALHFCLLVNAEERGSLVPAFSAAGLPHVCIAADDSGCCWSSKPCWESLMHCAAAGMVKFLFLVCAAEQTCDDAVASLHLAMTCFHSGGHVCLDVHTSSCIWSLPMFSHLVSSAAVHLIQVRYLARSVVSASWSWCTSLESLECLSKLQSAGSPTLHSLTGGSFFPPDLSDKVAAIVGTLGFHCTTLECNFSWQSMLHRMPVKRRHASPHALVDGGGVFSFPDWSEDRRPSNDILQGMRHVLMSFCGKHKIPSRLRQHLKSASETPLFTPEETASLRAEVASHFEQSGYALDWNIPEGQPYCLHALASLSAFMQDKDKTLFTALLQGVPTGFHHDIPLSGTLDASVLALHEDELCICEKNWAGAEADPALLQSLVAHEVAQGWLHPVPSLDFAKSQWKDVAVGKMNIVHSIGRKPRLVVDSSICGTNSSCFVPERYTLPSIQTVMDSFPLRESSSTLAAFSLDIKAAHKTIRVRAGEQGLLGVRMADDFFFYSVCPFGATFSAYWFARLGGFLVRTLHLLLYISHMLALYVDDLLGVQDAAVVELTFSILLAFCCAFGIPISWPKLQLGFHVRWIGWDLHFRMGCVSIPADKLVKLGECISTALRNKYCDRLDLHKICGLLQWLFKLFPAARPWLRFLYLDLNRPPGTLFSLQQGQWQTFLDCLSEDLHFHKVPFGAAISVGSKLLSVRHREVLCKADLGRVPLGHRRIWLRVADPASKRRRLSLLSRDLLQFWLHWSKLPPFYKALQPPCSLDVEAAADAMASGSEFGIGGYIRSSTGTLWFSEYFTVADFAFASIPLKSQASNDISSYECLAQLALVVLLRSRYPGARCRIRLASLCDNTGAESAANTFYSATMPLAAFAQRLAMLSSFCGIVLNVSHIAGPKNEDADFLSRWRPSCFMPPSWNPALRLRLTLQDLWFAHPKVCLHPDDASFPFEIPKSSILGAAI